MSTEVKVVLIIVAVVVGTVVALALLFIAALSFGGPIEGWQEAPPSYLSPSP
jgi:hypothetical protein